MALSLFSCSDSLLEPGLVLCELAGGLLLLGLSGSAGGSGRAIVIFSRGWFRLSMGVLLGFVQILSEIVGHKKQIYGAAWISRGSPRGKLPDLFSGRSKLLGNLRQVLQFAGLAVGGEDLPERFQYHRLVTGEALPDRGSGGKGNLDATSQRGDCRSLWSIL
jgi:hypothetical protein